MSGVNEMSDGKGEMKEIEDLMNAAKREISLGAIRGFARYPSDRGASCIDNIVTGNYPSEYTDVHEDLWSIMQEAADDADACRISPNPVDKYVGVMYDRGQMWLSDNLEEELNETWLRISDLQDELRELNQRRIELGKLVSRVWGSMHIAARNIRSSYEEYLDMDIDDVDDWTKIVKDALAEAGFERDGTPREDRTYIADTESIIEKDGRRKRG